MAVQEEAAERALLAVVAAAAALIIAPKTGCDDMAQGKDPRVEAARVGRGDRVGATGPAEVARC